MLKRFYWLLCPFLAGLTPCCCLHVKKIYDPESKPTRAHITNCVHKLFTVCFSISFYIPQHIKKAAGYDTSLSLSMCVSRCYVKITCQWLLKMGSYIDLYINSVILVYCENVPLHIWMIGVNMITTSHNTFMTPFLFTSLSMGAYSELCLQSQEPAYC